MWREGTDGEESWQEWSSGSQEEEHRDQDRKGVFPRIQRRTSVCQQLKMAAGGVNGRGTAGEARQRATKRRLPRCEGKPDRARGGPPRVDPFCGINNDVHLVSFVFYTQKRFLRHKCQVSLSESRQTGIVSLTVVPGFLYMAQALWVSTLCLHFVVLEICASLRASDESPVQQKARKNCTMAMGLQCWAPSMSTVTPGYSGTFRCNTNQS